MGSRGSFPESYSDPFFLCKYQNFALLKEGTFHHIKGQIRESSFNMTRGGMKILKLEA